MFVKGMMGPPGVNQLRDEDRMPVLRVVSGDTWVVDAELVAADGGPASPKNSYVEFVLAENQFSPPLWTGEWMSGVYPDDNRCGLVHVKIPRELTKALRRGSYKFSLRVGDRMRYSFSTQLEGNFLVEYMPTSDQHSIPYRDGTSEIFGGGASQEGTEGSGGESGGGSGGGEGGGSGGAVGRLRKVINKEVAMRYFVKLSMCVVFATLCHVLQADLVATRKWTEKRLQEIVSTNNADFVSAVTNCPVVVSGQSDTVDWGTYGTLGAIIAAIIASITSLSTKKQDRYIFNSPEVVYSTTDSQNDTASVNLKDWSINTVTLGSGISYATITFPEKVNGLARDFFLRLTVTGENVPSITFREADGSPVAFDLDDDSWAEIEQGVNVLMFTDTSEGV